MTDVRQNGALLDRLVQLAISRPFSQLRLERCDVTEELLPSLSRLLKEGSLEELLLEEVSEEVDDSLFFAGPHVAAFCAALRSSKLKTLLMSFKRLELFTSVPDGLAFIEALCGHPTLQTLSLFENPVSKEGDVDVGAALGRLLAAESALHSLDVSYCLGDDGLRPLFAAIAQSTGLRELTCRYSDMSAEFARDVVLPAIQRNVSLENLSFEECFRTRERAAQEVYGVLQQATAVVSQRSGRDHRQPKFND